MKTMKTNKLKLDKIESLGSGVQLAHMTLEIKLGQYCNYVQLSSTGMMLRIETSLLTNEISKLIEWLDEKDEDNVDNEIKIMRYAKEMIKANQKLTTVESL
jgi:hypothetical protein